MEKVLLIKDTEFNQINQLYDECLSYLQSSDFKDSFKLKEITRNDDDDIKDPIYESINNDANANGFKEIPKPDFKVENEVPQKIESAHSSVAELKSERLRRLSSTLPRIIITHSDSSLNVKKELPVVYEFQKPKSPGVVKKPPVHNMFNRNPPPLRNRSAYGDFPKRLVSKGGSENVALISNVPFEKIRLLNDTFHTLINLRWRWIVIGTVVVHFGIWLVFAAFWYVTALAHYDFEPDPPKRPCITGGKDFVTIFLASVEAQTTIGFGDRTIDEECPESIFLFIMQLILGTGLSGVLTCVVYAKLTRPEKLSRDGVGFSKKAVTVSILKPVNVDSERPQVHNLVILSNKLFAMMYVDIDDDYRPRMVEYVPEESQFKMFAPLKDAVLNDVPIADLRGDIYFKSHERLFKLRVSTNSIDLVHEDRRFSGLNNIGAIDIYGTDNHGVAYFVPKYGQRLYRLAPYSDELILFGSIDTYAIKSINFDKYNDLIYIQYGLRYLTASSKKCELRLLGRYDIEIVKLTD